MSEPAPGSVRAKPEMRSPLASRVRKRCFWSGVPMPCKGSTAPTQPCTLPKPAKVGNTVAILVRKGMKTDMGAACPPYSFSTSKPQYPAAPSSANTCGRSLPFSFKSVPAAMCRRTIDSESSIVFAQAGVGFAGGAGWNSSSGKL